MTSETAAAPARPAGSAPLERVRLFPRVELEVFVVSVAASLLVLLAERAVGIGWDYHPDAVTYTTLSTDMVDAIRAASPLAVLNNGYYVLCWMLGESVVTITAMNMLVFAATNVFLYRFHALGRSLGLGLTGHGAVVWLLLMNPYRLHLSTTVLKDTLVVFLVVLSASSLYGFVRWALPLAILRVASVVYVAQHLRGRYLAAGIGLLLAAVVLFYQPLLELLLWGNDQQMVLREFDAVPTFQQFGLAGSFMRALLWPLLAISGLFFALSPTIAYLPVAVGSLFTILYCVLALRTARMPLGVYGGMCAMGLLVTGFTAYIRYVYPFVTIWPVALINEARTARAATSA